MGRYLVSMLIRTLCFILVFVVHGPLRWVFVAGAVFLPYVAVIYANARGDRRDTPATTTVPPRTPPALGSRPAAPERDHPNG